MAGNDPAGNAIVDLEAFPNAKLLVERCHAFFDEIQDLYVCLSLSCKIPFLHVVDWPERPFWAKAESMNMSLQSPKYCAEYILSIHEIDPQSYSTPGHRLEGYLNTHYGPGNPYYEDFCRLIKLGLAEGWAANIEMDGPKYRRSKIALPVPESRFFSITTVYMESEEEYSGQYHAHPYGEINCVVQLDDTAELKGMQGWQGKGWTSPGAGTHHFPQVRKGALVALFFLPAGRISYTKNPEDAQPDSL